jgi:hypothetical protein
MLDDERLELADDLGMGSELEVGVYSRLQRRQLQLLEPTDLRLGKRGIGEFGKRWPAPQQQRFAELRGGSGRVSMPCLGDEALEPLQVELAVAGDEHVARGASLDHSVAEELAELGDVDVHAPQAARGLLVAPDLVEQPVGGDDGVRAQKESGE